MNSFVVQRAVSTFGTDQQYNQGRNGIVASRPRWESTKFVAMHSLGLPSIEAYDAYAVRQPKFFALTRTQRNYGKK